MQVGSHSGESARFAVLNIVFWFDWKLSSWVRAEQLVTLSGKGAFVAQFRRMDAAEMSLRDAMRRHLQSTARV